MLIRLENNSSEEIINTTKNNILAFSKDFFKDYNRETDKKLFVAVMEMYGENIDAKWLVPEYVRFRSSCKGNFLSAAEKLYEKSLFTDEKNFTTFINSINKTSVNKIKKDQFYLLATGVTEFSNTKCKKRADES